MAHSVNKLRPFWSCLGLLLHFCPSWFILAEILVHQITAGIQTDLTFYFTHIEVNIKRKSACWRNRCNLSVCSRLYFLPKLTWANDNIRKLCVSSDCRFSPKCGVRSLVSNHRVSVSPLCTFVVWRHHRPITARTPSINQSEVSSRKSVV